MNEDYGTKVSRRRYNYGTKVENYEDYGTKVSRRRYDYGTKVEN